MGSGCQSEVDQGSGHFLRFSPSRSPPTPGCRASCGSSSFMFKFQKALLSPLSSSEILGFALTHRLRSQVQEVGRGDHTPIG